LSTQSDNYEVSCILSRVFYYKFGELFLKLQDHQLAFRIVRRVVEISHFNRKQIAKKPVLNVTDSNQLILRAINDGKPLLVSRFGTTETEFCLEYGAPVNNGNATILSIENLWRLSGVFPTNPSQLADFFSKYTNAASKIDFCGVRRSSKEFSYWEKESRIFSNYALDSTPIDIEVLTPIFLKDPWTQGLSGKKVLIIHPFAETIRQQLKLLIATPSAFYWLPKFDPVILEAPQSLGIKPENFHFHNWNDSLASLIDEVEKIDFDIALIGCGAYGMPLGSFIKEKGKIAIHIGGALQLFFAIRGQRWESEVNGNLTSDQLKIWNWPLLADTPESAYDVEEGAYWAPKEN